MDFQKYQHIERFGASDAVLDIEKGTCYVFPKIDGTCSQVYLRDGALCAGSRNRELTQEDDNAGFYAAMLKDGRAMRYLSKHPAHRLFGEWLVPHSLRTYRNDAWRRFYVFDVCEEDDPGFRYLPYGEYQPLLEEFGLDYIPLIKTITNGDYESFTRCLDENKFLIQDGMGIGEGIIIKNYDYRNKYGRQTWAKIVTSEFLEKHKQEVPRVIEQDIVDMFVTQAFVEKEYAKISLAQDGWRPKDIPRLFNTVYHELICEEMWNICKKFKNPTVNFGTLNYLVREKIKQVKPEIFG